MDGFKPHIGKNVIETLTLGMYDDARFIYREYVQNAADQIDVAVEEGILEKKADGEINISIDHSQNSISIRDNATGIKSSEVLKFLGDVANSQKDRTKRKGFRGIGRLGGLGYCEELVFETSYKGENKKSTLTLNAKRLKSIIENREIQMDAATVISFITSLEKADADLDEHFFKVELRNVTNKELLDENSIRNYLSMVAPIPFAENFPLAETIYKEFSENNVKIEEYDIHLNINNEKLFKAYKTNILKKNNEISSKLLDVDFFKIKNDENELIAFGWYGVSNLLNKIIHPNNIERGLRLRKDNIQIGSEDTLNRFFSEDRFNHHFVGEIYVLGNLFIPNARRDYFNENETCQIFEKELRKKFTELYRLSHDTSSTHNRFKEIVAYKEGKKEFEDTKFRSKKEEKYYKNKLDEAKKKAEKARPVLEKIASKAETKKAINVVYQNVIGDYDLSIEEDNDSKIGKNVYSKPALTKLTEQGEKVVFEIFTIIEENLGINDAEKIKQKIIERYK